ncbi:MAG: hypothetical protein J5740_02280 [Bacteroidales bacterium]|nr:hypothetical protein [Bacteroidales bacterium]
MKKIFLYFGIAALAATLFSSCGKGNVDAVFDDSFAFVAFNAASFNIDEDSADTLRIPVTLASVAGLSERISYTVKDSTAKQGTNFTLVDETATLSFDAENRVNYIEIVPKADGTYTGDLIFTITLNASDNVSLGNLSTCTVRVNDIDHPLTPILGDWTFSVDNYWYGPQTFICTFMKDANDDHTVWFYNLFGKDGWKGEDTMYYGTVSDDLTQIVIPFGQEMNEYQYSGHPCYLLGFDGSNGYDSGSVTATITFGETTTIDFGTQWGLWVYIEDVGNLQIFKPGITGVKN